MKKSPENVEVVVDDVSKDPASGDSATMPSNTKKLLFYGVGIFVCYFYYGILQEKITRGKYGEGEKSEKFTYTMALVATQCVINAIFAKAVMRIWRQGEDVTPIKYYPIVSFTYLGAMVASNTALQHINYPTQVLGKSVKPIPVMVLGVLFAGKRYPLAKYLCVLLIVIGVALFVYKDKNGQKADDHTYGWGEVLLLVSLTLDGLTGATQDKMKIVAKTKPYHMMFNMNLWSILWLSIGLICTGELWQYIAFVQRYPYVLFNIMSFSICSAIGQNFIFLTVTTFGPLTCSIITTTRKFFTILASVIFFSNPMSQRQWLGTLFVFIGLGLDSKYGKAKVKH